jgi:hypothetical protein
MGSLMRDQVLVVIRRKRDVGPRRVRARADLSGGSLRDTTHMRSRPRQHGPALAEAALDLVQKRKRLALPPHTDARDPMRVFRRRRESSIRVRLHARRSVDLLDQRARPRSRRRLALHRPELSRERARARLLASALLDTGRIVPAPPLPVLVAHRARLLSARSFTGCAHSPRSPRGRIHESHPAAPAAYGSAASRNDLIPLARPCKVRAPTNSVECNPSYSPQKGERAGASKDRPRATGSASGVPVSRSEKLEAPTGHPTELDRALGYEANDAGTSFATPDKLERLQIAAPHLTFYADKTTPGALATCGYDDDGVQTGRWNLVENGVFVGYQTTRDQAAWIHEPASRGCSYANAYSSIPFQRMPNVSLAPPPRRSASTT